MEKISEKKQSFTSAIELLNWLTTQHQFAIRAPIDVALILKHLDIRYEEDASLGDQIVGKITQEQDGVVLCINPHENLYSPRKRFTIAHEIGHYCIHLHDQQLQRTEFVDTAQTMYRNENRWDHYEREANQFAVQLLMPKRLVFQESRKIIDQYKQEQTSALVKIPKDIFIEKMANVFDVSRISMEHRLKKLELIK